MRLNLVLHVDDFDMVKGGGWSAYDTVTDDCIASYAMPLFPWELTVEDAALNLAKHFIEKCPRQRQLPMA